jgi:hypothetical protein
VVGVDDLSPHASYSDVCSQRCSEGGCSESTLGPTPLFDDM